MNHSMAYYDMIEALLTALSDDEIAAAFHQHCETRARMAYGDAVRAARVGDAAAERKHGAEINRHTTRARFWMRARSKT